MDCRACSGMYITWDSRILGQLSDGVRARFPLLMTRKYACDQSDIALLHSRTLGNSPTALCITMKSRARSGCMHRQLDYLGCCLRYQKGMKALNPPIPDYPKPTRFPPFLTAKWFLAAYVQEVWSRMDGLLAAATSTYGSILKIDSTKICKKLQGAAANTASWATNVGNERGEVLQSVLTSSERVPALQHMLMDSWIGMKGTTNRLQLSSTLIVIVATVMAHQSFRCSSTSGISVCNWTSGTTCGAC